MNFVTIDIETANSANNSICEIGVTFVEKGDIVNTKHWLINPNIEIELINSRVHCITSEMVANSPCFLDVWHEVYKLIKNKVVIAHNASFDFSTISKELIKNEIPLFDFPFYCSLQLSKKLLNEDSYSLDYLSQKFNIENNQRHRAGEDSKAEAKLIIELLKYSQISGIQKLIDLGFLEERNLLEYDSHSNYYRNKTNFTYLDIIGIKETHNPDCIFYGKLVALTGKLKSMQVIEAKQKLKDIGAMVRTSTNASMDYLIVGDFNKSQTAKGGTKGYLDVLERINNGEKIKLIYEDEFLKELEKERTQPLPNPEIIKQKKSNSKEKSKNFLSEKFSSGKIDSDLKIPNLDIGDKSHLFYGKKVVITGKFKNYPVRNDLAKKLHSVGADINTSISKLTDFVIVGEGAGPKKMEKIEKLGIKTINEDELLKLFPNTKSNG